MSKNVFILSASPRLKGNSDVLCDEFMKGAIYAGHTCEKVFLRDKHIEYCIGCGVCSMYGLPCPIKDDMLEILEKMIHADVIVMATPVYFYTMDAQLKTLIDRTCSRYQEIKNKEFYFIVTAGENDRKKLFRTIDGLRGFTDCLEGVMEKGILYAGGVWKSDEIFDTPFMKEAYEMGERV